MQALLFLFRRVTTSFMLNSNSAFYFCNVHSYKIINCTFPIPLKAPTPSPRTSVLRNGRCILHQNGEGYNKEGNYFLKLLEIAIIFELAVILCLILLKTYFKN